MEQTSWTATWLNDLGLRQTLVFESLNNYVVARLDFQLRLIDRHEKVPNEFEVSAGDETVRLPVTGRGKGK